MGMAASQARLLTLTARLHDVEFAAQSIQNAKLQLATQQDAAYEEYQRALDQTSLTFLTTDSSGAQSNVVANYTNLFSINGANASGHHYALIDSRGRVVVSEEIYNDYHEFMNANMPENAYHFAMYMLLGGRITDNAPSNYAPLLSTMDEVFNEFLTSDSQLNTYYENVCAKLNIGTGQPISYVLQQAEVGYAFTDEEGKQAVNDLTNYFFKKYGMRVFNNENVEEEYSLEDFNYYVRMFNAIQQHGGCISIEDFDGPDGDAANNSNWLTAMIQSGQMTIETFSNDNQTLTGTSVSNDTVLSYTTTTQIDKVALAKAEAEYEHELKMIDRKDKKFDMDLNKLDTERSALTKQVDSIKKVVDDNIERTFGIFS